jgi:CHC2 zinc finger
MTQDSPQARPTDRAHKTVPFSALRTRHAAAAACQLDAYFPEWSDREWRLLRVECDDAVELANDYDPLDYPSAEKRHQPARRSTAATSTRPGAVMFSTDDPLKQIEPRVYVEALTGEIVPGNGMLSCPLPDHDDRTPSFQVLESHWRCFGCNRGGGIIDLAAALYGIEPRGQGYWQLRDRILERLVWAPIGREGER